MNLPDAWWNPMSWDAPFPVVAAALATIAFLRAGLTYTAGRFVAAGGSRTRVGRVMERPGFVHAVDWINRVGAPVVSLCFLTVGVQTMVNLAAGFLRMPLWRYLPALAVGSALWGMVYASVGFVGFAALALAWQQHPVLAVLLLAGFVALMALLVSARRTRTTGPGEP